MTFRWVQQLKRTLDADARARTREIQQNPYCRLQTAEDVALAVDLGLFIDANRAAVDDWLRLPYLSIHQARQLVALRQAGVMFYSLDDLSAGIGVSSHALQPFAALIQFQYYAADDCDIAGLDPNYAPVAVLAQLPGVGEGTARAIVAERQTRPFSNLADLQRRLALPRATVNQLLPYLRF
ncbi:MAG: helix-hairpin-helix domain-containing protein [Cyanobacteria bacterium P01_A01_bin.135]